MEISTAGGKTVEVSETVFGAEYNPALVHQVVTAMLNTARAGTKNNKSRSDVAGGGAKPWRQKGSGQARAGTRSSPIFRSGGVTFAARPRDYSQKVNRKMYRGALISVLSQLNSAGAIKVIDELALDEPKTAKAVTLLNQLDFEQGLLVDVELDRNVFLAVRNLPHIEAVDVQGVTPLLLVQFSQVVITAGAIGQLNERLAS
ncbi:MAG: 50S ribosomal protein L4 [Gammaproteobacteria bacterium AqS3]|nr:50S ribosomal protein L4 [Gammaproteobacteria bacterium AqS3]